MPLDIWREAFCRGLEQASSEPQLYAYLDELLDWGTPSNDQNAEDDLRLTLLERYGERELRSRYERVVERLIFHGNEVIEDLFSSANGLQEAKLRYRKLMRVFHPDIGVSQQSWLNSRSEKLNGAYRAFISRPERELNIDIPSTRARVPKDPPASGRYWSAKRFANLVVRYNSDQWRKRLGKPDELKMKLVFSLFGTVLVVLILVFLA